MARRNARWSRSGGGYAGSSLPFVGQPLIHAVDRRVGQVALVATKVGRTFTNRVLLNFDQPIVEQICRLRFGE
ncbi:MAG TPA: hypothetical protein PKK06_03435 [Phycisphaerae bacterium]|nr:hypothetical protein [Phycisphaerae bacterium]HNU44738.1 hypothetical protein [Phycisphaerae bacterium]